MTGQVNSFVDHLIQQTLRRKRQTEHQKVSINFNLVVDNAIMPSQTLRILLRKESQRRPHCFDEHYNHDDEPAVLPSQSSPSVHFSNFHGISSPQIYNSVTRMDLLHVPWNRNDELTPSPTSSRSPRSVLVSPSQIDMGPQISPRSARWTSSFTPPQTLLKSKTGLKRLDSDAALTCPQRLLLSPGGDHSFSSHSSCSARLEGKSECSLCSKSQS